LEEVPVEIESSEELERVVEEMTMIEKLEIVEIEIERKMEVASDDQSLDLI